MKARYVVLRVSAPIDVRRPEARELVQMLGQGFAMLAAEPGGAPVHVDVLAVDDERAKEPVDWQFSMIRRAAT